MASIIAFIPFITAFLIPATTIKVFQKSITILMSGNTIPFIYFSNILKLFKSSFDFGKVVQQYNFDKLPKLFVHQARKDGITRV